MVGCAAFGCTSRYTKNEKDVGFFSFPKDAARCRKWMGQLNRAQYVVNVNSKLCSKHFEKDQFVARCVLAESVGFTGKFNQRLNPDAIPSIFYRPGKMSPRKPRSSAASIMQKKLKIQVKKSCQTPAAPPSPPPAAPDAVAEDPYIADPPSDPVPAHMTDYLDCLASVAVSQPRMEPRQETFSTQTQTPYNLVRRSTRYTQCTAVVADKGTQTTTSSRCPGGRTMTPTVSSCPEQLLLLAARPRIGLNDSFMSDLSEVADPHHTDWLPDNSIDQIYSSDDEVAEYVPSHKEKKFIVFESCLDLAFRKCNICGGENILHKRTVGTYVNYKTTCCVCGGQDEWDSQPMSGTMPYGNIVLTSAILLAGASANKVLRVLDFACVQSISSVTFTKIQSSYVTPSILNVWKAKQADWLQEANAEGPLKLAGDAR